MECGSDFWTVMTEVGCQSGIQGLGLIEDLGLSLGFEVLG